MIGKTQLAALALSVALVPGMASADLIAALDFTGGGSAWTTTVMDPGTPGAYPHTLELGGDPTKVGYLPNTTDTAAVRLLQEVFAPAGYTMENLRLDAKVSGFSGHIHLGRIGMGSFQPAVVAVLEYWTGVSQLGGTHVDTPVTLDDTGPGVLDGRTSVWVGVEVHKGIAGTYVQPDVSAIMLYGDLIPEPSSIALMAIGALALLKRRFR